jgi:Xaa-Pro aminopeptidase
MSFLMAEASGKATRMSPVSQERGAASPGAAEYRDKQAALQAFLEARRLDGVLLWERGNFAWITCGGDNRIPDNTETGVAGILATRERRICLADAIEAPRMRDEELADAGIDVVDFPWHDEPASRRRVGELLGDLGLEPGRVGADQDRPAVGFAALPAEFNRLRWSLTPQEMDRYRECGARAAGAMEQAAEAIEPGMTEHDISAVIAHFIRAAGLVPNVNLVATDERIFKFRHPIPTARELERYAMLVTCASLGGLVCSLTRFVHFGEVPADLKRRQQAVADVDAAVNFATRPDRTLGEIFADLQQAYASAGFAEEWKLHHQGGPTGYANRERVAVPGDETRVLENQAFAWNPSITGAKSEDTILVMAEGFEVLTGHSGDWPTVIGHAAEGELPRAGCLVK